jgi:hypothetical protein
VEATVQELVEGFKKAGLDDWETYWKAHTSCYGASLDFAAFCAKYMRADLLELKTPLFKPSFSAYASGHYVVWLPDAQTTVDWTCRQYLAEAPYPLIQTPEELSHNWKWIGWEKTYPIDVNRKGGPYG